MKYLKADNGKVFAYDETELRLFTPDGSEVIGAADTIHVTSCATEITQQEYNRLAADQYNAFTG